MGYFRRRSHREPEPLIRRTTKIVLELAAILVAGLAVMAGLFAWRLSSGPIALDFLAPYVEEGLATQDTPFTFRISELMVTWGGWSRPLNLLASDVAMVRADGSTLTRIPVMEVELSARDLLGGRVTPTRAFVIEPELTLRRRADGTLSLGLDADRSEDGGEDVSDVLIGLASAGGDSGDDKFLSEVRIVRGDLTVIDEANELRWTAPDTSISLQRDRVGLRVDFAAKLDLDGEVADFHGSAIYNRDLESIALGVNFADLLPGRLGARLRTLEYLNWADLRLRGEVTAALDVRGRLLNLAFDLTSGPGHLILPGVYPDGMVFESAQVAGELGSRLQRVNLSSMIVDLGGGTVAALAGEITNMGRPDVRVVVDAAVTGLPLQDLDYFWPEGVGGGARRWITSQLSEGAITSAQATLVAGREEGTPDRIAVKDISGSIDFEGISVSYLNGMPPVVGTRGTARFDGARFDIDIEEGRSEGMAVRLGHITLSGLGSENERVGIALDLRGPLRSALQLIDHEPLQYARKLDIDPESVSGDTRIELGFDFPLLRRVTRDELNPRVHATLSDLRWRDVAFGLDADGGTLELDIGARNMQAKGILRIGGNDLTLRWTEAFGDTPEWRSDIQFGGVVTDATLLAAGIDLFPFVRGPTVLDLDYKIADDGRAVVSGSVDLERAEMEIASLGWRKSAGEPAAASLTMELAGGVPRSLSALTFTGRDLAFQGGVSFRPDGAFDTLHISELRSNRNHFAGSVTQTGPEAYAVQLTGRSVDLTPLLSLEDSTEPEAANRQLAIAANVDRVYIKESADAYFESVSANLRMDGDEPRDGHVRGTLPGGGAAVDLTVEDADDQRRIMLETADAGGLLRTIGLVDTMQGGDLKIGGRLRPADDGSELLGRIEIKDFRLVEAPVLAQILTLASMTGIVDTLAGNGIAFSILEGELVRADGVYDLRELRANGPSLGVTMNGQMDTRTEMLDLRGTIVPAYFFNSLLGRIPVLGQVLVGEKGSGVFAFSYQVTGPRGSPTVTVNPLSALLPGALRNLFSPATPGDGSPVEEPKMRSQK